MSRTLAVVTLLLLALPLSAGVGDPTLQTEHRHYPGEGAFQTVEQCVAFATAGQRSDQEKAIALYLWLLTHQFHLASPQEWNVPGKAPDTRKDDMEMIVYDANRARFSYGYGLCGTVHAWNEPYWRALGFNARRRAFPGHTNSEVEYGGSWHAFDTDMAGLVFRNDGLVAGYEDIIKDPKCVENDRSPLPRYPFAWPGDFQGMKDGWKQVAKGGNWYKMYNSGYAAQPGIVHLRSGETFTRTFDRDHFGGPAQRRFWHVGKGGPFRDWTFVNMGDPEHFGPKSNSRGNASYCNGEFVYRPSLTAPSYREGVVEQTQNLGTRAQSPRLHSTDGGAVRVVFQHFAPYVICGQPLDGVNPMSAAAQDGFVVSGLALGSIGLEVSADQGQTWHDAGRVTGKFEKDLTEFVKGRYGWQARLTWEGKDGLDLLQFATVTQVAQPFYPRLQPDGCTATYRAGSRAVVPVLPNFATSEASVARYEEKALRSGNVVYVGRSEKQRFAYQVQGPKAGSLIFKVQAPGDLLQVTAAARFNVRVPPPEGCDYRLEVSTDLGQTWQPLGRAVVPKDNEYSSGWMYGTANVASGKPHAALVRVHLYGGGTLAGLLAAELYGIHATPPPGPVKITWTWKEGPALKTHVETIPAGATEKKFTVPTGKLVVDVSVRLEAL